MQSRKRVFTLIELLVVVAIIAILASLLLPSLSQARESSRRSVCAGNLRQLFVAAELYADDMGGYYPTRGYNGKYPHIMAVRLFVAANYTANDHLVWFCPSSIALWKPPCQPWAHMTSGKGGHGGAYFGYGYHGGVGGYGYLDRNWYSYRWGGISSIGGKRHTPTPNRTEAMRGLQPEERPFFMDNAFYYGTSSILMGLSGGRSAPAHNHTAGSNFVSVFENIVFVDGHLKKVTNPYALPVRGPYGMRY